MLSALHIDQSIAMKEKVAATWRPCPNRPRHPGTGRRFLCLLSNQTFTNITDPRIAQNRASFPVTREVDNLGHEVFPVNIVPSPEVIDATGKKISTHGFGQIISEQAEHAGYDVELTGNSQVKHVAEDDLRCH